MTRILLLSGYFGKKDYEDYCGFSSSFAMFIGNQEILKEKKVQHRATPRCLRGNGHLPQLYHEYFEGRQSSKGTTRQL